MLRSTKSAAVLGEEAGNHRSLPPSRPTTIRDTLPPYTPENSDFEFISRNATGAGRAFRIGTRISTSSMASPPLYTPTDVSGSLVSVETGRQSTRTTIVRRPNTLYDPRENPCPVMDEAPKQKIKGLARLRKAASQVLRYKSRKVKEGAIDDARPIEFGIFPRHATTPIATGHATASERPILAMTTRRKFFKFGTHTRTVSDAGVQSPPNVDRLHVSRRSLRHSRSFTAFTSVTRLSTIYAEEEDEAINLEAMTVATEIGRRYRYHDVDAETRSVCNF